MTYSMDTRFRLRRDTAEIWAAKNPVLLAGEPGFESDTNRLKIGDGVRLWLELPYLGGGSEEGGLHLSSLMPGHRVVDPNTTLYGVPIVWRVADLGHEGYPAGSVTLIADEMLAFHCFDAAEPSNPESRRAESGNGRWSVSNLRQWLNSEAGAGEWYSPQHEYDQAPDNSEAVYGTLYAACAGFLNGFSAEMKAALMPTTVVTGLHSTDGGGSEVTTDRVFLPSLNEVGIEGVQVNVAEGSPYRLFSNNLSRVCTILPEAWENASTERRPTGTDVAGTWWTRTTHVQGNYTAQYIKADGSQNAVHAYDGLPGTRPVINLPGNLKLNGIPAPDGAYHLCWQ